MRIVLSRKGFDSGSGGYPSPILPDNTLCSLPIPEAESNCCGGSYPATTIGDIPAGAIVEELTSGEFTADRRVHLDPDLNRNFAPREDDWRPIFGQAGAAEAHLQNQGVGEGDVFLFFGWFRRTEQREAELQYIRNSPHMHIIFGWLQVAERIPVMDRDRIPSWALYHPHCHFSQRSEPNSIYISPQNLTIGGSPTDKPGAGVFKEYHRDLCLTELKIDPGKTKRSFWRLPKWFDPSNRRSCLSCHGNPARWHPEDDFVRLRTVPRGQEFVLNSEDYPEAVHWLLGLVSLSD